MTSIVTDFKSIRRKLERQEQKAEFEEKNPPEPSMYGWPYGVAVPLKSLYGGAASGAMGEFVPFDAQANLKAALGGLSTNVALLERLQNAVVKI